jgi:branched-chain amino acid transport system substrate-binding protein
MTGGFLTNLPHKSSILAKLYTILCFPIASLRKKFNTLVSDGFDSAGDEPARTIILSTCFELEKLMNSFKGLSRRALLGTAGAALLASMSITALAADAKLKIGFVGVTSGPAAAWGTSNVRSMQTLADIYNGQGGVKIGDKTYELEIVTFDDQKDPKRAVEGMEKMAQEGIHYVVGPNVDDGAAAVRPVAEKNNIIYFPYAFPKELYTAPASNAVLGMIANYQSGPAIYKYLMENKGVKKVAFVAANESDPLSQRDGGVAAAKALGLEVVADKDTYQNDTRDFTPVMTPIVALKPDLIVLSGVAPANAPLLIRSARELGYEGIISTETAQDAKVLMEGAGELANGFISVGGASTPEIASDRMKAFVEAYTKKFGEYNDESNTKVYALDYILETMKANPAALDNIDEFKKTMDTFSAPNPYLKGDAKLSYVGTTSFGQKRQVAVPMVVNEYKDGAFQTLFVGTVD